MTYIISCLLGAALLFTPYTNASVALPNDGPYTQWRKGRTLYIYDQHAQSAVPFVAGWDHAFTQNYERSYSWRLDEPHDLILLSPAQQITNGYATVIPNTKTVWYPSGAHMLEASAHSSWGFLLASHELAHLYQLNAKSEFPALMKKIFGNQILISPFFFPIFVHPNLFTPTFILEGNATFNESRWNMGGRLHSGEIRAEVLAQIQAGDIDPSKLINDDPRFPFGEAYHQGAYFQAHLAAKHGIDKTNGFFLAQGSHWFFPLILNRTFRDHFGDSYPQEIREYVRAQQSLAKNQAFSNSAKLVSAVDVGDLNHDDNQIWFLASDYKSPPRLYTFDKKTQQLSSKSVDMAMGKVFWQNGAPYSSASVNHSLFRIEYSLYGEGLKFDPRYRGQVVTDQRAGVTAAQNAGDGWLEPQLLKDGQPYDVGHSSVILDAQGNLYYFRQNGVKRILYRNKEPVFAYDGFYGKPMEVDADGTFYFIGNTDYGSTLYKYSQNEVVRVLASDRVVAARKISGDEFLVVEVSARDQAVHIDKATAKPATPAVYSYGFPSQNLPMGPLTDQEQIRQDEKSYSGLRELRRSATNFDIGYSSRAGTILGAEGLFVDPMEYHQLMVGFLGSQFQDRMVTGKYLFSKYLPNIFTSYTYKEDFWREALTHREKFDYNQQFVLGMQLPFLKWRRWSGEAQLAGVYKHDEAHGLAPHSNSIGTSSKVNIGYSHKLPLAFWEWRHFEFGYHHRYESYVAGAKKLNANKVHALYRYGFGDQYFGTLAATAAWAETHDIELTGSTAVLSEDISIPRLVNHNKYRVKNASALRFEFTKAIDINNYTARIPLGIFRVAPFGVAQGILLDNDSRPLPARDEFRYPNSIFEWSYGLDMDILFAHKMIGRIRFGQSYDTRSPQDSTKEVKLKFNF